MRSRFFTLLIPFLFWSLLVIALFALGQNLPQTEKFFSGRYPAITSFGAFDYLNAVIGITRNPLAYQFWYVRDLILLAILSPALHWLLKRFGYWVVGIFGTIWFFDLLDFNILSPVTYAFFSLGAYCAFIRLNLFALDRHGFWLAWAYILTLILDVATKALPYNHAINSIGVLLGMATAFYLTGKIIKWPRIKNGLITLGGYSFFIFCAHEPLLTMLKKILYSTLKGTSENPKQSAKIVLSNLKESQSCFRPASTT